MATPRHPPTGVIFHSDRSCQYTSTQLATAATKVGGATLPRAHQAMLGTTPSPSRSSPPSKASFSSTDPGRPTSPRTPRSSTTSNAGTSPNAEIQPGATSARPPTKTPPPPTRLDQHNHRVRQSRSAPVAHNMHDTRAVHKTRFEHRLAASPARAGVLGRVRRTV